MGKKIVALIIAVCMISGSSTAAYAKITAGGAPVEIKYFLSNENLEHNFVEVKAQGSRLEIRCETPLDGRGRFSINARMVEPENKNKWVKYAYPVKKDGYYTFSTYISSGEIKSGDYVLVITMLPAQPNKNKTDVFYKNCNFRLKNGTFYILQHETVMMENEKYIELGKQVGPEKFMKKDLSDMKSLIFTDPVTGRIAPVTQKKMNYFKKISDEVTEGATSDYEKTLKIYEYTASSFYYDSEAFKTGEGQYADPYRNLYNLRNGVHSENSDGGKVATVCTGFSAVIVALCRAQDIPARLAKGHHMGLSSARYNNWSIEEDITEKDHWWAEVYIDGRWVIIDATAGTSSKWNRETNDWSYTGLTNYVYFDPTIQQFAAQHLYFGVKAAVKESKI